NNSQLIADEPTGNIDPELSFEIVELLNEINKCGTTVVMVTHAQELVEQFDHRVVILDRGTVSHDYPAGGGYYD
ncbi:MAG: cell division ATP-binding protein FtsE, partial [Angelakisella sp.]